MLGLKVPVEVSDPNADDHVFNERLRPRLVKEFERLGSRLRFAMTADNKEEIRDLFHQVQGIAGYFQFEGLEQKANACRQVFETGTHQQFTTEVEQFLTLLEEPHVANREERNE